MNGELSKTQHADMLLGYELAWAANATDNLRTQRAKEVARLLARIILSNPSLSHQSLMQTGAIGRIEAAAVSRDLYTLQFNGLMESAAALMPDRNVIDANEIVFRTYSDSSWSPM